MQITSSSSNSPSQFIHLCLFSCYLVAVVAVFDCIFCSEFLVVFGGRDGWSWAYTAIADLEFSLSCHHCVLNMDFIIPGNLGDNSQYLYVYVYQFFNQCIFIYFEQNNRFVSLVPILITLKFTTLDKTFSTVLTRDSDNQPP